MDQKKTVDEQDALVAEDGAATDNSDLAAVVEGSAWGSVGSKVVKASGRGGQHSAEDSLKETFESIIISFFLVFVFRSFIVEPFIIPTGSMAPTLLGLHDAVTCDSCLYQFDVGRGGEPDIREIAYQCPMCGYQSTVQTRGRAGDRILVHKYIYDIIPPSRWDVIVFKNPKTPYTNYIKRLVGLPGESLWIIDGNIYTKKAGDKRWSIARKSSDKGECITRRGEQIQRAVWQPIYHSQFIPNWELVRDWAAPWREVGGAKKWVLGRRRAYTFRGEEQGGTGQIQFDFTRFADSNSGFYPYNSHSTENLPRIEDLRIAGGFELLGGQVDEIKIQTSCRMDNPRGKMADLYVKIDSGGRVTLWRGDVLTGIDVEIDPDFVKRDLAVHLKKGRAVDLELWYVDQQASFWVNKELVLTKNFDGLGIEMLKGRSSVPIELPRVRVAITGGQVRVHRLEVDRDLYYHDDLGQYHGLLGVYRRRVKGNGLMLGKDHFYALGDNSPNSADSRYWQSDSWSPVNPWIVRSHFQNWLGEKAGRTPGGRIHRDTLMGQAFAVYFPSAYGKNKRSSSIIPDFGRMRLIK